MVLTLISAEALPIVAGGGLTALTAGGTYFFGRILYSAEKRKRAREREEEAQRDLLFKEGEKEWQEAMFYWRGWLLAVVEERQTETRADTIRQFYQLGQVKLPNINAIYKPSERYYDQPTLTYQADRVNHMKSYNANTELTGDPQVGRTLCGVAQWESFARLVEVAPQGHAVQRSVDKFLKTYAANLYLNFVEEAGQRRKFTEEEASEAYVRQVDLNTKVQMLMEHKLSDWVEASLAPRKDPVKQVLSLKEAEVKALVSRSSKPEDKNELALEVVALPENGFTEEEAGAVTAYEVAAPGLPEERRKEAEHYIARLREAVEASKESAGFAEEYRDPILELSTQNRAIALQGLNTLVSRYGSTKESELLLSLRVSNKYLLAKTES